MIASRHNFKNIAVVELCFAIVISTQIISSRCYFQIVAVVELCFAIVISTQITSSRCFFKKFLQDVSTRWSWWLNCVRHHDFAAEFYSKKAVIASREQLPENLWWKQLPEYDVYNDRCMVKGYNWCTTGWQRNLEKSCLWLANRWRFQICMFMVKTAESRRVTNRWRFR